MLELVPTTPRVFPVGRLDRDTEGLLILTNDGDLAQLLTHPSHGVEKEYLAEVDGIPTAGEVRRLREGVELEDGPTLPARVRMVQEASDGQRSLVEIVVKEGRKRMVRRMCRGGRVIPCIDSYARASGRSATGPLAPAEWRVLTAAEVRSLYAAAVGEAEDRTPVNLVARGCPGAPRRDHRATRTARPRSTPRRSGSCRRCSTATGSPRRHVSIIFTATDDITAEFPATAARSLGLGDIPLHLCPRARDRARQAALHPGA